jgi:DNA mismatch endonuclease, patch repair protein
VVFPRERVAVFVDGCFWHQCPEHATIPANNREWWQEKLATNVNRDRATDDLLESQGWIAIRVWEHEEAQAAAARIRTVVINRRPIRDGGGRGPRR